MVEAGHIGGRAESAHVAALQVLLEPSQRSDRLAEELLVPFLPEVCSHDMRRCRKAVVNRVGVPHQKFDTKRGKALRLGDDFVGGLAGFYRAADKQDESLDLLAAPLSVPLVKEAAGRFADLCLTELAVGFALPDFYVGGAVVAGRDVIGPELALAIRPVEIGREYAWLGLVQRANKMLEGAREMIDRSSRR